MQTSAQLPASQAVLVSVSEHNNLIIKLKNIEGERMKTNIVLIMLFVGLMTMGADCVNDNAFFSVNIQGLSGTYQVNRGDVHFGRPQDSCRTIRSSEYLDASFGTIGDVRIYDIRLTTIGNYSGTIVNAVIKVNEIAILTVTNKSWSAFSTPQSIVTSNMIARSPNGISTLIAAIRNRQSITICPEGEVSNPINQDDLYLKVEVFGQVDGRP